MTDGRWRDEFERGPWLVTVERRGSSIDAVATGLDRYCNERVRWFESATLEAEIELRDWISDLPKVIE